MTERVRELKKPSLGTNELFELLPKNTSASECFLVMSLDRYKNVSNENTKSKSSLRVLHHFSNEDGGLATCLQRGRRGGRTVAVTCPASTLRLSAVRLNGESLFGNDMEVPR
ncbi:hypothetical protein R3I94_018333 [Phoxinus phoxinus]